MRYLYCLTLVALAFFSFTFVDLNLTILNWQPYLTAQQQFTQLGYFNRPINAAIQTVIFLCLVICFVALVTRAASYTWKSIKCLVVITAFVTGFGYNAYSFDLFNYMFDARIITKYGQNPYQQKALDYPQDQWTRFMHWTHRTYPYGPTWLVTTVPLSFLGNQKFLLTFMLFKALFVLSYLAAVWYLFRIIKQLTTDELLQKTAVLLFATNPLIIIDGLLSAHMDLVMGAIGLVGVYFAIRGFKESKPMNDLKSLSLLIYSAGIKYATAPWLVVSNRIFLKYAGERAMVISLIFFSLVMGVAQAIYLGQYQPWYGLLVAMVIPLAVPYFKVKYLLIACILISIPIWIYINFAFTGIMVNPFSI